MYWPISPKKDNQKMKLSQLIEYKIKKRFLEKSSTKCVGKTSPRLFSKKLELAYIYINSLKVYDFLSL